jgi:hypothetical protein
VLKDSLFATFDAGELGGGKIVDAIVLTISPPNEGWLENSQAQFSTSDLPGIRLGMAEAAFLKLFPKKVIMDSNRTEYWRTAFADSARPAFWVAFYNRWPMLKSEMTRMHSSGGSDPAYHYWHEYISIMPRFAEGRLIRVSFSKTTEAFCD